MLADPQAPRPAYTPSVAEHVVPHPYSSPGPDKTVSCKEAQAALTGYFADETDITIITDWPDDVKYLSELLLTGPGTMIDSPGIGFEVRRVDANPTICPGAVPHNAMWDASALRQRVLTDETMVDLDQLDNGLPHQESSGKPASLMWAENAFCGYLLASFSEMIRTPRAQLAGLMPFESLVGNMWSRDAEVTDAQGAFLATAKPERLGLVPAALADHLYTGEDVYPPVTQLEEETQGDANG